MAKVANFTTLAKADVTANHFIYSPDIVNNVDKKLQLQSLFPAVSAVGTAGENIFTAVTNKNQFNLKKLSSADAKVTVTTDATDSHLVVTLVESQIDLNVCNNTNALFLKTVDLTTNVGATILGVANGGTGASTLLNNGVLVGSGTSAVTALTVLAKGSLLVGQTAADPTALVVGANGTYLKADSTSGSGLAWGSITSLGAQTATLDMNGNNIDMAGGWINNDGSSDEGLIFDSTGKAFMGDSTATASFTKMLNIKGGTNGGVAFTGGDASIFMASGTGSDALSIIGSSSSGATGGIISIEAGASTLVNGNGGALKLHGGLQNGTGGAGAVNIYTYAGGVSTLGLSVTRDADVLVASGHLAFDVATKGIVHKNMGSVTQATDHSTAVTVNNTMGIITLAAVSLASGAEATFIVNNSTAKADSIMFLTVDSPTLTPSQDDSVIIAQITSKAAGSFKIILKNVGDAATDTNARKINFLIINATL